MASETLVYPGHDYKGDTVSTIGEEKAFNPRLQVSSADEYAEIMDNLDLPDPKMMDQAIPANLAIGFHLDDPVISEYTLSVAEAAERLGKRDTLFIDVREDSERERDGVIPGSIHAPYPDLGSSVKPGGLMNEMVNETGKSLLLYCAYGERSALALKFLNECGIENACHLGGGIDAWINAGLPLEKPSL